MSAAKVIKNVIFTVQAQNQHNSVKFKNVLKWLKSGHEIRVKISGREDRQKAMESLYSDIEKKVGASGRFLQKTVKPETIGFTLQPTKDAVNIVVDENNSLGDDNIDLDQNQDVFSEDFEKQLEQSIREEMEKRRKKK